MSEPATEQGGIRLAPGFEVLALRTPTLPPATTTNTALVGEASFVVIEPATPHADERERLRRAIDARIEAGAVFELVLVTHHHRDHVGYAIELAEHYRVPVGAHPETARRVALPELRPLGDGDRVELADGRAIDVVHTPGHAPGHLVFVDVATRIAHAGDMVAGEGFVLIDPADAGDMTAYLDSLERLQALATTRLVPAHGPIIDAPWTRIDEYLRHRRKREAKVLAALGQGAASLDEILTLAYDDTPSVLWPIARKSLLAHLLKLESEGRAARQDERWCGA